MAQQRFRAGRTQETEAARSGVPSALSFRKVTGPQTEPGGAWAWVSWLSLGVTFRDPCTVNVSVAVNLAAAGTNRQEPVVARPLAV
jgi:hypothetical protein